MAKQLSLEKGKRIIQSLISNYQEVKGEEDFVIYIFIITLISSIHACCCHAYFRFGAQQYIV